MKAIKIAEKFVMAPDCSFLQKGLHNPVLFLLKAIILVIILQIRNLTY